MKLRLGFVSNSSSSSFIVIDAIPDYEQPDFPEHLVVDSSFGTIEFGWGQCTLTDIGSRIILAYFQALYKHNDEWITMLEKCIKENTNVKTIDWKINIDFPGDYNSGYIDHQSTEMAEEAFDDEETLKDFIFGKNSQIVLDNDNH